MNYIINPSWFYWLGVANGLSVFFTVIACLASLVSTAIIIAVLILRADGYDADDDELIFCKSSIKITLPIAIISWVLVVFLPSKQTLIEMQVARFATYENAEWTLDTVKAAVDYIIESIKSIQ